MTTRKPAPRTGPRPSFGSIRKLASGRFQVRYTDPDGAKQPAPTTFESKGAAEAWLAALRTDMDRGAYKPAPAPAPLTFGEYAEGWLAHRVLKPRTRDTYRRLLDRNLLPTFGALRVKAITPDAVVRWHTTMGSGTPTLRSQAYGLLRTILGSAVQDQVIASNPAHIRGAGNVKRAHKVKPATLAELEAITEAMPERHKLMVTLAAWCALRFGELTELRRTDIDLTHGVVKVRRGVVRTSDGYVVGSPKSDAGVRDVAIPKAILPLVREHLADNITGGRDGLLFPAADGMSHLAPSAFYGKEATGTKAGWGWYHARAVAGRPDLRFHDLRHTGAVLAAQTGATLAELMGRLGHSTPGAAMRYQHAAADRDRVIADALSEVYANRNGG